jgi:uncharacterized protein
MKLNIIKDLKVDELIVFASLPDMGMVGGLDSTSLPENLETEHIAEIISSDRPWV